MDPRVGRFRLLRRLARGGMGEVWLGRDDTTGTEAALKWMLDLSPRAREHFEAEIRAIAAMSHPNLVVVYDAGRCPSALSLGDSTLPAGAPWFAMELLQDKPVVAVRSFAQVERVLSSVLRALAHAHARGWIHCDLKPDNVMSDSQGRVVVTDFGVARPLDPGDPLQGVGGTPEFMAPEQLFVQEWRLGPWTDLFAVGLLSWVMCTGASPIPRADLETLRRLHGRPLPMLRAPFPLPRGFADWVDRLLQPQPAFRFRSAADALAALANLDAPQEELPLRGGWFTDIVPAPRGPGQPMPSSWRAEPSLQGSRSSGWERGLGLVRRRELPLVGRQREQDALWAELSEVIASGAPRIVQVVGEGGIGKTALSRWLCERVEELGVARAHRVPLGPGDDVPRALLVRVLGRLTRALSLPGQQLWSGGPSLTDALWELGISDPFAVAALLRDDGDPAGAAALSPMKGARSVCEALVALSEGRPVVVWLDDAERATSALVQLEALKEVRHPVLVVVSSREPLLRQPPHLDLSLLPMAPESISALLQEVVPLDPALAVWIRDRSGGLPLVALSLLGELIDRGGLRWNGIRWATTDPASLPVPETVRELLVEKVQRVVPDAMPWVEIAAVLGTQVDTEIWDEVSEAMRLPPRPEDLVRRLVDGGILSIDPRTAGRLWFNHALVAEAIAQQTREKVAVHQAAAARYEARGGTSFERAAEHWLAAGQMDKALEAWYQAVWYWSERDLLVAKELAIRTASRREASPAQVARLACRLAAIYRHLGDWHRALDACERGLSRVDPETDPTTAADLYQMRSWVKGALKLPFEEDEERVAELLPRVDSARLIWKIWMNRGMRLTEKRHGGLEAALSAFGKAIAAAPTEALRDEARVIRAAALCTYGQFQEGLTELEAVRDRVVKPEDPFHSVTWLWIHGHALADLGQPQGLLEMQQALQLRQKLGGVPTTQLITLAGWATRLRDVEMIRWALHLLGPGALDLDEGRLLAASMAALQGDLPRARQYLDAIERLQDSSAGYAQVLLRELRGLGHPELEASIARVVAQYEQR